VTSPLLDPGAPLTRSAVRDAAVQLLGTYVPDVQGRIYRARTWPTQANIYPCLLVYAMQTQDSVISADGMPPDFDVELTLAVHIRVEAASVDGKRPEEAAEDQLDALAAQVQQAMSAAPEWVTCFNKFGQRTYAAQVQQGGDRIAAEGVCTQVVHYFALYQPPPYPLLEGATLRLDAVDPADLTSDYTVPSTFPAVAPAPRTRGPDGRAEAIIDIPTS
jgi:hypothetical protein